jgi:hypothetical protein
MALPRYDSKSKFIPVLDHRQSASGWALNPKPSDTQTYNEPAPAEPELTDAERARTIVAGSRMGTLSVSIGDPPAPIGFVVSYSLTETGEPVLVVRNGVARAGRIAVGVPASLTIAQTPLTASQSTSIGGVTILGKLVTPESSTQAKLLREHGRTLPNDVIAVQRGAAKVYWVKPVTILLSGTYQDVVRLDMAQYMQAQADPLAAVAPGLASHLVGDQNDSLVLLCRAFGGQSGASSAQLVGLDQYGMDLMATVGKAKEPVRLAFNHPVSTADEVRRELATMVRGARFKLGVG